MVWWRTTMVNPDGKNAVEMEREMHTCSVKSECPPSSVAVVSLVWAKSSCAYGVMETF